MSLYGMRKALGEAIGNAANREEVDAIVAVLTLAEDNFKQGLGGSGNAASASRLGELTSGKQAVRFAGDNA